MGRSSRAAAASICINNTGILQQPKKIIKDQNLDQTSYFNSSSREGKNKFCIRKEVQITPLSIGFGTLNPPKFELGHLTPLSIKYQANYPHRPVIAVLLAVLVHVDQWF
jgi:hypothetical protein